jgi:uncharacterized protein YuzE
MRVRYDADADPPGRGSGGPGAGRGREPGGVIVGYGEDGEPASVEFLNASERGMIGPVV